MDVLLAYTLGLMEKLPTPAPNRFAYCTLGDDTGWHLFLDREDGTMADPSIVLEPDRISVWTGGRWTQYEYEDPALFDHLTRAVRRSQTSR